MFYARNSSIMNNLIPHEVVDLVYYIMIKARVSHVLFSFIFLLPERSIQQSFICRFNNSNVLITTSRKTSAADSTKKSTAKTSKTKKETGKVVDKKPVKDNSYKYEQYFNFSIPVRSIRPHQVGFCGLLSCFFTL